MINERQNATEPEDQPELTQAHDEHSEPEGARSERCPDPAWEGLAEADGEEAHPGHSTSEQDERA
eukprot:6688399-Lingulodinium_polyedra.AAC.1